MAHSSSVFSPARRRFLGLPLLGGLLACGSLVACGDPTPGPLSLSSATQPIFGGSIDTDHPEVMLLASRLGFLCTGTLVHVEAQAGFLLTAAHCVTEEDGSVSSPADFEVLAGEDFSASTRAFAVESVRVAPGYDGSFAANDIAVVRFFTAGEALASIPVLPAERDALAVGDGVLLVGYGQTEADADNTLRRQVSRSIEALDEQLLVYSQEDARGACFGDSGGPILAQVAGAERVAGVISGGISDEGEGCAGGVGVAIRTSGHDAFIRGALASGAPG